MNHLEKTISIWGKEYVRFKKIKKIKRLELSEVECEYIKKMLLQYVDTIDEFGISPKNKEIQEKKLIGGLIQKLNNINK